MKQISGILLLLFTLNSCIQFEQVKFLGISNVSSVKKDGKAIDLDLDLRVDNPNTYNIKVKPSQLDVYLNDSRMGIIHLNERVKLKKKAEDIYTAKLTVELDGFNVLALAKSALTGKVELNFKGKIKAGNGLITKSFDINEKKELDLDVVKNLTKILDF